MDKHLKEYLHRHNVYSLEAQRGAQMAFEYIVKKLMGMTLLDRTEQLREWYNEL